MALSLQIHVLLQKTSFRDSICSNYRACSTNGSRANHAQPDLHDRHQRRWLHRWTDRGNPVGPDGFFNVGEDYLDLLVSEYPETLPTPAREALGVTAEGTKFDAVLQGRMTYQIGLDEGLTNAYRQIRQHLVFSQTMAESPDPSVELVSTDPVARVQDLKREAGKHIWLCGGATLASVLSDEIDESRRDGCASRGPIEQCAASTRPTPWV